jgi:hypothetical protein
MKKLLLSMFFLFLLASLSACVNVHVHFPPAAAPDASVAKP